MAMAVAPPPTTAFPADPSRLERLELDRPYLAQRGSDKSLMIRRGELFAQALRKRLMALAGDLEDAGDDLTSESGRYRLGRRSFQGACPLGSLVQVVGGDPLGLSLQPLPSGPPETHPPPDGHCHRGAARWARSLIPCRRSDGEPVGR